MTTFNIGKQFNESVKVTLSEKQPLTEQTDSNIEMIDKSAKRRYFFQKNKPSERKYTKTRIELRNFLWNIAYVGIIKDDF